MTQNSLSPSIEFICPTCHTSGSSIFFYSRDVPVHSVVLLNSRTEAINFPTGDITLALCPTCGFIFNAVFNADLHDYSSNYEATQGFSPTFNAFHRQLATRLIEEYDLYGKQIIEIGCGQGEFLALLCDIGNNHGVGFDPAFDPARSENTTNEKITFIKDFYSESYAHHQADFVCCKMTLEHIRQTADFVSVVRRSIGDNPATVLFFQVPDVTRILRETAFWDIYYEHCSYFSPTSLAYLFQKSGFDVINLTTEYDDQYLMIEARPGNGQIKVSLDQDQALSELQNEVADFVNNLQLKLAWWQNKLAEIKQQRQRVVIWGGGSKGVAFLTTLDIRDEIEYVVDINPHKHGAYIAGTGQEIVAPSFLQKYEPHIVIVMNPVYCDEIRQALKQMGIAAELIEM
jgi:hypothetical protein